MNALQLVRFPVPAPDAGEVLSPESHVFVALMSVEEGPNKAVMLGVRPLTATAGAPPEPSEPQP